MATSNNIERGPLSAPVTITWEVTLGCNLYCDHCLSGSGPGHQRPRGPDLQGDHRGGRGFHDGLGRVARGDGDDEEGEGEGTHGDGGGCA